MMVAGVNQPMTSKVFASPNQLLAQSLSDHVLHSLGQPLGMQVVGLSLSGSSRSAGNGVVLLLEIGPVLVWVFSLVTSLDTSRPARAERCP